MTDPFWMLLVLNALGDGYVVWDQAGEIAFLKPGRGTVHAQFRLDGAVLDEIRAAAVPAPGDHGSPSSAQAVPASAWSQEPTASAGAQRAAARCEDLMTVSPSGAVLRWFETDIVDASGDSVARVRKQLYVRRKMR